MTEPPPPRLRPVSGARDVTAVAFQRAMSNGPISRRLGWFGVMLLPLTVPMQIPAVLVGGDLVLRRGGASLMRGRHAQIRPAAMFASLLGPFALMAVLLAIELATGLPAGWLLAAALVLILVELAGSLPARGARLAWRRLRRQADQRQRTRGAIHTSPPTSAVPIAFVVAFPRGGRRGSMLMSELEALLDTAGQPAVLTARTSKLVEFYARDGFHSLGADPRQMLRTPRPIG